MELLVKGWEIEKGFESVSESEVDRYATNPHVKSLMPRLMRDSARHEAMVRSMIDMVKTERPGWNYRNYISRFPFNMSWDLEMVRELARVEKRVREHYSDIYVRLVASDSSEYLGDVDRDYLLAALKVLVRDEGEHYRLCLATEEALLAAKP